jgi:hypothetical protein
LLIFDFRKATGFVFVVSLFELQVLSTMQYA